MTMDIGEKYLSFLSIGGLDAFLEHFREERKPDDIKLRKRGYITTGGVADRSPRMFHLGLGDRIWSPLNVTERRWQIHIEQALKEAGIDVVEHVKLKRKQNMSIDMFIVTIGSVIYGIYLESYQGTKCMRLCDATHVAYMKSVDADYKARLANRAAMGERV